MSSSSLWAVAVITVAIVAGIVATLLTGEKELAVGLIGIGTTLAAAVAALAARNNKPNDKDASQ